MGPLTGLLAQALLLAALAGTVGLGGAGWATGAACALATNSLLARGLARYRTDRLGPADWVTLTRVTLAGGVAALTADSLVRPAATTTLVSLAAVALALDAADGQVARRTRTQSSLGASFDGEADAFLMLVLSVYLARPVGAWVLAIGAARYAFLAAGWWWPWLRAPLPPRYWRKVAAATAGVALVLAATDLLQPPLTNLVLAAALALIAESFGRDVVWLWRRRRLEGRRSPLRAGAARLGTAAGGLLLWFALLGPSEPGGHTWAALVRLPLEALLFVGAALLLPPTARRIVAAGFGTALGLLVILRLLDLGFRTALNRPFDPAADGRYLGSAIGVLGDSIGATNATVAAVVAGGGAVAVVLGAPWAAVRLTRLLGRHRARSLRVVTALSLAWVLAAVAGLHLAPGVPLASTSAAQYAAETAERAYAGVAERREFAAAVDDDLYRATPGAELLTGLSGKDVLFAFVESYGRVAVEDSEFSPGVVEVLDEGTGRLQRSGFAARSAFLTSPTFGGLSWLAHASLQSGVRVSNQARYDELVATDRTTLSVAFKRAGWRTVSAAPANRFDWPQGTSFYHYDQLYDSRNVGYAGPKFSYAPVPDQYTLAALQRLELGAPNRPPLMAEIDLVSSHTPWAPLPRLVAWADVGDGSVFAGMPAQGDAPDVVWRSPARVRAAYAQSIEYSLSALISFVEAYADDDLVLVVLGDHQPATIVSGPGASHDVPITILSRDPAVLERISPWGWQEGLLPDPGAPVWPMEAFRDRFLAAYGPPP